jgi:vacuolar-type H+-ATPase subunit I/STV1
LVDKVSEKHKVSDKVSEKHKVSEEMQKSTRIASKKTDINREVSDEENGWASRKYDVSKTAIKRPQQKLCSEKKSQRSEVSSHYRKNKLQENKVMATKKAYSNKEIAKEKSYSNIEIISNTKMMITNKDQAEKINNQKSNSSKQKAPVTSTPKNTADNRSYQKSITPCTSKPSGRGNKEFDEGDIIILIKLS